MRTVIFAVLPVLVVAAPQRPVIPHLLQPYQSFNVANERWCLVRCVELTPTADHLETCDGCKSLEVLYRVDDRQLREGCSYCGGVTVDCNKLLRAGDRKVPSRKSCCKCSQPAEGDTESEVSHQPPIKREAPKRGRIRAVIVYHPRKRVNQQEMETVSAVDGIPPDLDDQLQNDET